VLRPYGLLPFGSDRVLIAVFPAFPVAQVLPVFLLSSARLRCRLFLRCGAPQTLFRSGFPPPPVWLDWFGFFFFCFFVYFFDREVMLCPLCFQPGCSFFLPLRSITSAQFRLRHCFFFSSFFYPSRHSLLYTLAHQRGFADIPFFLPFKLTNFYPFLF